MPKLVILQGIPCAGKSTWAASQCGNKELNYILSRDDIRVEMNPQGKYKFDPRVEDVVTNVFTQRFDKYMDWGYNIYMDNTNLKIHHILLYIAKAKAHEYEIEYKKFPISLWKAQWRNIIRWMKTGKYIPFKMMKIMQKNYKKLKNVTS